MKKTLLTILIIFTPLSISAFTITTYPSTTQKVIALQLVSGTLAGATIVNDPAIATSTTEDFVSGSSSGQVTTNDITYNQFTTASFNYHCFVDLPPNSTIKAIDPTVMTVNSSGVTTYIGDGTARFNVNSGQITRQVSCPSTHTSAQTSTSYSSLLASSLAGYMEATTTVRVQSLSPSASTYNIFSSTDDTNHVYVRNTSLWASSTDLTSIPAIQNGSQVGKGILVAPDILISASHACATGVIYFVDNTNTTYSRSVTAISTVGTDICVVRLSSDLPASVKPAKVFPSNFVPNKVTNSVLTYKVLPLAYTNQFRTLRIGSLNSYTTQSVIAQATTTEPFSSWFSSIVNGDSGNAVVAFVNGQTVAVGTWYTAGSSSVLSAYISQINTAMTSLGSAYSLTQIDLSGFPTY